MLHIHNNYELVEINEYVFTSWSKSIDTYSPKLVDIKACALTGAGLFLCVFTFLYHPQLFLWTKNSLDPLLAPPQDLSFLRLPQKILHFFHLLPTLKFIIDFNQKKVISGPMQKKSKFVKKKLFIKCCLIPLKLSGINEQ